ncbi:hypothetical protein PoB_007139500 [Plakobranchus ocellatus]|uniref:Uncharacterized protein n=1 Tax=Plakobranchus ocellatus TaxID=259542 RepID=A0AAV4DL66_9GAST|nr:hypothetical protein PoB_007139500 [Plakobranchus ocellatus]
MKNKPNKWGGKLYELGESSSGYMSDFEIYAADPNLSNKPVNVCMRLCKSTWIRGSGCTQTNITPALLWHTSSWKEEQFVWVLYGPIGSACPNAWPISQLPKVALINK